MFEKFLLEIGGEPLLIGTLLILLYLNIGSLIYTVCYKYSTDERRRSDAKRRGAWYQIPLIWPWLI